MKIGRNVFIAHNATLIGDVTVDDNSFILYGAVLRGDQNSIYVGKGTNVQDNAVVHADAENETNIGDNVSIGHGAIIHGSVVNSNSLIGMGAILMSGSVIEEGAVVGAGSLVTSGTVIGKGCLAVGSPAKILRCDDSIREMGKKNAAIYQNLRYQHSQGIHRRYIP